MILRLAQPLGNLKKQLRKTKRLRDKTRRPFGFCAVVRHVFRKTQLSNFTQDDTVNVFVISPSGHFLACIFDSWSHPLLCPSQLAYLLIVNSSAACRLSSLSVWSTFSVLYLLPNPYLKMILGERGKCGKIALSPQWAGLLINIFIDFILFDLFSSTYQLIIDETSANRKDINTFFHLFELQTESTLVKCLPTLMWAVPHWVV